MSRLRTYTITATAIAHCSINVEARSKREAIRKAKDADPTHWDQNAAAIDHDGFMITFIDNEDA